MTALSIVQNAASALGITAPTALFSATDDQTIQLRNLMNIAGVHLAKGADTDHAWRVLQSETTFSTTAAAAQTGAIPSDFGWFINDTFWNRTTRIKLTGPISPEEWQQYQAISMISLPAAVFRVRGTSLLIYPSPVASQTCAYEYVTKNWANTAAAVAISTMTADTDVSLIDESLITLSLIWRFLAAKGLDYAEPFRTFQLESVKAMSRDGGRKKMNLAGRQPAMFNGNIPDGSWP